MGLIVSPFISEKASHKFQGGVAFWAELSDTLFTTYNLKRRHTMAKISNEQRERYAENDRLFRTYKATQALWFKETLASSERPAELMKILRYIRAMPVDKEQDFIERIVKVDWVMNSPPDVRMLILRVVGARMDELNGEFNDPMFPDTNMFFEIKRLLNVR